MRSKFYLYASGREDDIRALDADLKLPGSEIKALRPRSPIDQTEQGAKWMWRSSYQECSTEFPEDEFTAFLHDNPGILQRLKAHRTVLHELTGMIVSQFDANEQPRGYSVSSVLIRQLADANASLEIDIEQFVDDGSETKTS